MTLLLMTIGVVAALVAGDTLEQLFVADAEALWGEVDVEVTSGKGGTFEESFARTIGTEAGTDSPAWAPRLILRAVAISGDRRDADAVALGLGPEDQTFTPLESIDGTDDVLRLDPDEVIVNERLAGNLGLEVGSPVTMVVAVPEVLEDQPGSDIPLRHPPRSVELAATVAGVVADTGAADLGRTPNVLLRRDALRARSGVGCARYPPAHEIGRRCRRPHPHGQPTASA